MEETTAQLRAHIDKIATRLEQLEPIVEIVRDLVREEVRQAAAGNRKLEPLVHVLVVRLHRLDHGGESA